MNKKMLRVLLIFFVLLSNPTSMHAGGQVLSDDYIKNAVSRLNVESDSVLVMEAETGRVIFDIDGYSRRFPASITKIMTALLVLEQGLDLDSRITLSTNAVALPHYASSLQLRAGESLSVRDAMYGLMLASANEIARAFAEHVSGTQDDFIFRMNQRARQLGAMNTQFINPCGLPGVEHDNQWVTAYDIALVMKEALKYPFFVEVISTAYYDFPPTASHPNGRVISNHNRLIRPTFDHEYDRRVVGGKTGFTNAAQHTLVSYARHDGFEIIISTLFAPDRATFMDTKAVMDVAFDILRAERAELARLEAIRLEEERLEQLRLDEEMRLAALEAESEHGFLDELLPWRSGEMTNLEALFIAATTLGLVFISLGILRIWYTRGRKRTKRRSMNEWQNVSNGRHRG